MQPAITTLFTLLPFALAAGWVHAQPAALEAKGIFGECLPVYAAAQPGLRLHAEPNLDSASITIPYQEGWKIEAPKREGLTRVLTPGALRALEDAPALACASRPTEGPDALARGETVDYLYYLGEGFGEIRFRGAQCQAEVDPSLEAFETLRLPEVQLWLKVFNADGSSPGWLLHDGTQARVVDVLC